MFQQLLQQAIALHQQGQWQQADALYARLLDAQPGHPDILHLRGMAAFQQQDFLQARAFFEQALARQPNKPMYHSSLGNALAALGEPEAARARYLEAHRLDPAYPDPCLNLARLCHRLGQLAEALAWYHKALAKQADPALYNQAAALHLYLRELEPARLCLEAALALDPRAAETHFNLGKLHYFRQDWAAAQAALRYAISLDPGYAEAHFTLALVLLLQGDFPQGFREYAWRWRLASNQQQWASAAPAWQGEPLAGRRILLYPEQGFGDALQFIRYVPEVAARGGEVLLLCPAPLRRLLEGFPGITALIPAGDPLPDCDVQAPLMALPGILGTTVGTIPGNVPYLEVPRGVTPPSPLWGEMTNDECGLTNKRGGATGDKGLRRIGVVWAGNAENESDRHRSCPLEYFRPLFDVPGIEWYSLQVGNRVEELYQLEGVEVLPSSSVIPAAAGIHNESSLPTIIDLSPAIQDFADTAAIISQLDLIITVDTAVAHLAGAMAKPVWILLSYIPDWRWMLARDDSPWYPTARLFRQPAHGDWESLFARLYREIGQIDFQALSAEKI